MSGIHSLYFCLEISRELKFIFSMFGVISTIDSSLRWAFVDGGGHSSHRSSMHFGFHHVYGGDGAFSGFCKIS